MMGGVLGPVILDGESELVILCPVLPTSLSEQMSIYMLGPGHIVKMQNPCPPK